MILLFSKKIQNKQYLTNAEVYGIESEEDSSEFQPPVTTQLSTFFAPTPNLPQNCTYPLNVRELFPYWLRASNDEQSVLLALTEQYYNWLTCDPTTNSLSFLRLEDLFDLESLPIEATEHTLNTYLNAFPKQYIDNPVDRDQLLKLVDNVKVNLYAKKGTKDSFKLLINEFFNVDPDLISVSYPKQYILRLNSGRYEWMRTNPLEEQDLIGEEYPEFFKNTTGSFLNYSVMYDNDLWQDFSYVVNAPAENISEIYFKQIIKPLVHPAGTKDFFQLRFDIFNNDVQDQIQIVEYENPTIQNYALYTIGSTATIGYSFGCSGSYGGVTGQPSHVFPYWDEEIETYYIQGMSFGEINTGDFFNLSPAVGFTYLNRGITCG
jgi:hypothetical protein